MKPGRIIRVQAFFIICFFVLISGCSPGSGDGVKADGDGGGSETSEDPVLYIGMMVHLEGYDLTVHSIYNEYKSSILALGDIFTEYGAKLTLEAKEPVAACDRRNDNFLKILEDKGHGIGVHADAGGVPKEGDTWETMSRTMKMMKAKLEKQKVSVRHVSGYCSPLDWVRAVSDAGYSFVSGGVTWCLMSLPEDQIPSQYLSCSNPAECHDPYPVSLRERLHAWTIKKGKPWTENHADGELVFIPTAIESLPYLSEKAENPYFQGKPNFDDEDIDRYIEQLEKALTQLDSQQPNFAYVGWSYGTRMPEAFARKWLSAVEPYVETGQVEWKTIPEMYDIYVQRRDSGSR